MAIQFRCSSISHFDKASGQYVPCGQSLQAPEAQAGQRVRCPRCQQMARVPDPALIGSARSPGPSSTTGPRPSSRPAQAESTPPKSSNTRRNSAGLKYSQFDKSVRCSKCGSPLDREGKCTACYFVTPSLKPITTPVDQIPAKPAGFQLWLRSIMSDGIGSGTVETAMHSLVALAATVLLLVAIVAGGNRWPLAVLGAVLLVAAYVTVVVQVRRLGSVPAARIPFYLRPFWYLILVLARAFGWRRYDSRLANRLVIDVRGQAFSDRDLLELENLDACQVLDADGTDLTDAGLAVLHGHKQLSCLVVRRSHVTREGVYRLQQSIPRCWIWF